jgi:hypothetical protein
LQLEFQVLPVRLAPVGTHPATIFVDQPIDPFFTRPACTTFLHVLISKVNCVFEQYCLSFCGQSQQFPPKYFIDVNISICREYRVVARAVDFRFLPKYTVFLE